MKPLATGIALSFTLVIFYSLCTLAAVMWSNQFMEFMNGFFHRLDFTKATSEPYSGTSFFAALAVLPLWGLAAGAFFAWLHNAISAPFHGRVTHE